MLAKRAVTLICRYADRYCMTRQYGCETGIYRLSVAGAVLESTQNYLPQIQQPYSHLHWTIYDDIVIDLII